MKYNKEQYIWGLLRLAMGWLFLWAFFDKLFGLGFATSPDNAWLAGASPTFGFLKFATQGPFAFLYQSLAGNVLVDWLFMLGLLFVGVTLTLGILVRLGGNLGLLLMFFIYTACLLPPEHTPFLDEHVIYAIIIIGFIVVKPGSFLGLGEWWSKTKLVNKYQFLE